MPSVDEVDGPGTERQILRSADAIGPGTDSGEQQLGVSAWLKLAVERRIRRTLFHGRSELAEVHAPFRRFARLHRVRTASAEFLPECGLDSRLPSNRMSTLRGTEPASWRGVKQQDPENLSRA